MATGRTQRPLGWRGHTRGWVGMPSHCIKKSHQQCGKVLHWTSNILLSTVSLLRWNVILAAAIAQASYYDTLSPSTHKVAVSAPGLCDKGLKWTWHPSLSGTSDRVSWTTLLTWPPQTARDTFTKTQCPPNTIRVLWDLHLENNSVYKNILPTGEACQGVCWTWLALLSPSVTLRTHERNMAHGPHGVLEALGYR